MSHRRPVCHIVRDVHERPVWRHEWRVPKWIHWILVAVPTSRTLHVLQDGAVWRSHPLDLLETDKWAAICSAHVISYGLLENSPCGFMSPRRIYDVSHRHHSWPPFMRDRTSAVPWRVTCSFRERKLEFLSTQTQKLSRFCSFAGKLPLFCLRKTTKQTKGSSGLALGLTSMAARPEDTAKLPPRPPWGPPTRARDCRWLASVGISEAALMATGAGAGRCLGGHQMRQIAAKWPRQPSGGAARKARGGHAPGIVVNYRETMHTTRDGV